MRLTLTLLVAISPLMAHGAVTVKDGKFSDPTTWDVPPTKDQYAKINHAVTVDSGVCGRLDVATGAKLTIAGTLDLHGSLVVSGTLEGTAGEIRFHVANDRSFVGNGPAGPDPSSPDFHPNDIGLWGLTGSTVHLKGAPVTSWLNAVPRPSVVSPVNPPNGGTLPFGGASLPAIANGSAVLQTIPLGWKAGDKLVLAALDGTYAIVTLLGIARDGVTIVFNDYRFSAPAIRFDNRTVYPKVGNLTRRLVISSADVTGADPNHRAHVMLMHGGCAQLDHVEFRNLGPRGKMGRYPVHYHKMGVSPCCRVNGCSVWQTVADHGNRFIAVHDTSSIQVTNNIGLRSRGHGYFSETGHEAGNEWSGNLSIDVSGREELTPIADGLDVNGRLIVGATNTGNTTSSHYWLRSGSKQNGNVAIGGTAEFGLILLNTYIKGAPANEPLRGWECHSIKGWSFWVGVTDTEFVDPISTYAAVSATTFNIGNLPPRPYGPTTGLKLTNPTLLLNGTVKAPDPNTAYAGQLFLGSHQGFKCTGGLVVGKLALSMHYKGDISIKGTKFVCDDFCGPTYWQFGGVVDGCDIKVDRLFNGAYPLLAPTGVLTIQNSKGTVEGKPVNGRFTHGDNTAFQGVPEPLRAKRITK